MSSEKLQPVIDKLTRRFEHFELKMVVGGRHPDLPPLYWYHLAAFVMRFIQDCVRLAFDNYDTVTEDLEERTPDKRFVSSKLVSRKGVFRWFSNDIPLCRADDYIVWVSYMVGLHVRGTTLRFKVRNVRFGLEKNEQAK